MKKLIILIIIGAICGLAAVKNPGETEAKQMVRDAVTERIQQQMQAKANSGSGLDKVLNGLGQAVAPKAVEHLTDVEVKNYVVFSTFKSSQKYSLGSDGEDRQLSGIILFGKVLPL